VGENKNLLKTYTHRCEIASSLRSSLTYTILLFLPYNPTFTMSAMMKRLLLTMGTDCLSEPACGGLGNLEREFFPSIIMTRR
jgi:hypothetical protein